MTEQCRKKLNCYNSKAFGDGVLAHNTYNTSTFSALTEDLKKANPLS